MREDGGSTKRRPTPEDVADHGHRALRAPSGPKRYHFRDLATFERAMQLGIEDYIYAVGMSRIRHFYVETVPQAEKYFVGSIHDDFASTLAPTAYGIPITPGRQSLLTVPGAIAMVNGVIVGAFAGLLVGGFIVDSFAPSVGVGLAAFVVSGWLQRRHQIVRWDQMVRRLPTLFPSKPTP